MQKPTNQKQPTLDQSELANQPNHHQENEQERPENQKQSIVLIGDSVIKDIIPEKISARKVHKFCYPGKTAKEIASDIQTINIRDLASYVIIHAGTNNLPEQPSSTCLEHIQNLCLTVKSKFGNAKIGISGITLREDIHLNDKIQEVNNGIKEMCKKCKYTFIDNSNIKSNSLNRSKLYLNTKGSALLASGFIKFLRGGRSFGSPRSNQFHARNFRPEKTLRQMQDIIRIVVGHPNLWRGKTW